MVVVVVVGVLLCPGFEERSRRIKLYRQREAVHEKKRLREEELKRRQELAKGYTGQHTVVTSVLQPF